jgi:hypothetical protein
MQNATLSQESNMQTDEQENYQPAPIPPDWTWLSTPVAPNADRVSYQAARRAELDDIRRLDLRYRELLDYFRPLGNREDKGPWDGDTLSPQDLKQRDKVARELYLSHRFLVCAVEVYLLGCVEYPVLTGKDAVSRAPNTDSLIATLQEEEDLMIKTYGSPWAERTSV